MRVLLDARMGRKPTGIGNYVTTLSSELGRMADGQVRVLCRPRHAWRFRRAGVHPVVQTRGSALPDHLSAIDIVHGPNFHAPLHPTAGRIATVHDLGYRLLPACHPAGMPERLDALVRASLDDTRMFLCNSVDTQRAFSAEYGVDAARCRAVPLGVDATFFTPDAERGERTTLRRRYGLERPYVLFVGAMVPRKDLVTLAEAWAQVAVDEPDLDLVLAGNKTLRWASDWPKVADWLTRHPVLAPRVQVLDYVRTADLPALYRGCEVSMLTSLLEGFGLTVLEAMACGRPVVVTRSGALPEVGGTAAYYGEARDPTSFAAALRAALDRQDGERRDAEAARIVAEHPWARTARLTLDAYAEVADDMRSLQSPRAAGARVPRHG